MKTLPLNLAILASLVAAPAFAQDTTGTTAADKRWAVVGSATVLQPADPVDGLEVDGDVAPTVSASFYATPNIAIELWGAADKFNHRVRGDDGKIGTVDQQPIALSGQYHFGTPDQTFRPFVGLGYYESNFSEEDVDALAGNTGHVGIETSKGAIGTVGVDMNIDETWFARADARYMKGSSDLTLNGESTGDEVKHDPWTVGIGIGARF